MKRSVPASYVSADHPPVFEHIPDHLYEQDPGVVWVPCPVCAGEGVVPAQGAVWYSGSLEQFYPGLDTGCEPCLRCHSDGEVLDLVVLEPLGETEPVQLLKRAA